MMNYLFLFFIFIASHSMANPHPAFVSLEAICPGMIIQMDYSTKENFTGSVVPGYKARKAFLAKKTAEALCKVQGHALKLGFTLKIFDSYRPVKAVNFFQDWAREGENNPEIKSRYYPHFTREELFTNGYIASRSSHSRGSAVDLTLHHLGEKKDLDMGGIFDFFHEVSSTVSSKITPEQQRNRFVLRDLMEKEGFKNFSQEWWHYSLKPEPFPDEYFDFDVE